MKQITIKSLRLLNFKGVRDLSIDFKDETNIYGRNTAGKTTVFDAFLWLLFGKDSTDRKDFEIKTLDEDNNPFHKLTHEVTGVLDVNGDEVTIRHSYKEKWPTKKGTAQTTFSGHENEYFWNDVPCSLKEYQEKIASIVDESIFKLITNTQYFAAMKWQDKRQVLLSIAGEISNEEVFGTLEGDFEELQKALTQGKSIEEFRKQINAKKKIIRDEKDLLPSRIDEAKRSLPDFVNYGEAEKKLAATEKAISDVEKVINDSSLALQEKQNEKTAKAQKVQALSRQISEIEFTEKNRVQENTRLRENKIQDAKRDLNNKREELIRVNNDITRLTAQKDSLNIKRDELRTKWAQTNATQLEFKAGEFDCPACQRPFEATNIEERKTELTTNFNKDKAAKLADINTTGTGYKTEAEAIEKRLQELLATANELTTAGTSAKNAIAKLEEENTNLSANDEQQYLSAMAAHEEYVKLTSEVKALNEEIAVPINLDNSAQQAKRKELQLQIDELKEGLAGKGQREKLESRIAELQSQEESMAQQLAQYEGIEFSINQYNLAKMNMLTDKVNNMFRIVKFKMFNDQINGGLEETCIMLINGVPYSDANTASKINAGVDVISVLSNYYQVHAPIFIDNRESVTDILETESQIVNLIVSPKDKKLRVEAIEKEMIAA